MNLGDPELELVDPTPNIHALFIQFDTTFFWTKLASRAVVRWSKRMYSCAGICSYEGRGGLCDIALSEPLLKLRPRKDLVETLLHEMIHAFLFVTCRDQDRDGHGPNFKAHMHRINKAAGLNISIYHSFHDEVELYQTHWWRCNGPCQTRRPHFGIVRRTNNRAPGPTDYWWNDHQRKCGGTFIKIKEPEKKGKKKTTPVAKPKEDITKYITNQKTIINNVLSGKAQNPANNPVPVKKQISVHNNTVLPPNVHTINSVLKDNTNMCGSKGNGDGTAYKSLTSNKPPAFTGEGHKIGTSLSRSNSISAAETVRSIWSNKKLSSTFIEHTGTDAGKVNVKPNVAKPRVSNIISNVVQSSQGRISGKNIANTNKTRASTPTYSPPAKMKKIDDYFTNAATILKDVYGKDFNVTQTETNRLVVSVATPGSSNSAVIVQDNNEKSYTAPKVNQVNCPICNIRVNDTEINRHLDECLNKDIVNSMSHEVIDNMYNERKELVKTTNQNTGIIELVQEIENCRSTNEVDKINISKDVSPRHVNLFKTNTNDRKSSINKQSSNSSSVTIIEAGPSISKPIPDIFKTSNANINTMNKKHQNDIRGKLDKVKDEIVETTGQKCACCGNVVNKPVEEHLDECLAFFGNNTTIPEEGASTSADSVIIIDDDDQFDDSQTFNDTGTKFPCPCCLQMVEELHMNTHLDVCIGT